MAGNHGAATAGAGMDMPAHEATYEAFISLTQLVTVSILCIVLELVLWGIKGHGLVALVGFIVLIAASAFGGISNTGWKAVAPVFVLLALACIVL